MTLLIKTIQLPLIKWDWDGNWRVVVDLMDTSSLQTSTPHTSITPSPPHRPLTSYFMSLILQSLVSRTKPPLTLQSQARPHPQATWPVAGQAFKGKPLLAWAPPEAAWSLLTQPYLNPQVLWPPQVWVILRGQRLYRMRDTVTRCCVWLIDFDNLFWSFYLLKDCVCFFFTKYIGHNVIIWIMPR